MPFPAEQWTHDGRIFPLTTTHGPHSELALAASSATGELGSFRFHQSKLCRILSSDVVLGSRFAQAEICIIFLLECFLHGQCVVPCQSVSPWGQRCSSSSDGGCQVARAQSPSSQAPSAPLCSLLLVPSCRLALPSSLRMSTKAWVSAWCR